MTLMPLGGHFANTMATACVLCTHFPAPCLTPDFCESFGPVCNASTVNAPGGRFGLSVGMTRRSKSRSRCRMAQYAHPVASWLKEVAGKGHPCLMACLSSRSHHLGDLGDLDTSQTVEIPHSAGLGWSVPAIPPSTRPKARKADQWRPGRPGRPGRLQLCVKLWHVVKASPRPATPSQLA